MVNKPEPIQLPRKPHYVTIAANCDFFDLFKKIEKRYDTCFMLESLGEESYISRHSIIGFDPESQLWAEGNTLNIQKQGEAVQRYQSENPYYLLRDIVPQDVISRKYAGGLTGYLGYDSMNYFEPSLSLQSSDMFDAFRFGLYKDGLILDKMTGEVIYFYYENSRLDLIQSLIDEDYEGNGDLKITPMGETSRVKSMPRRFLKLNKTSLMAKYSRPRSALKSASSWKETPLTFMSSFVR